MSHAPNHVTCGLSDICILHTETAGDHKLKFIQAAEHVLAGSIDGA